MSLLRPGVIKQHKNKLKLCVKCDLIFHSCYTSSSICLSLLYLISIVCMKFTKASPLQELLGLYAISPCLDYLISLTQNSGTTTAYSMSGDMTLVTYSAAILDLCKLGSDPGEELTP